MVSLYISKIIKEKYMRENPEKTLDGTHNKRLDKVRATNSEKTAAWANAESKINESQVAIPAEYDVEKAKNWVDNGSQL
jgi:hypothetical protein